MVFPIHPLLFSFLFSFILNELWFLCDCFDLVQGLSQDLETGCLKLAIVRFLGA